VNRRVQLVTFANEEALADSVAVRWLDQLESNAASPYLVALSGGRIARRFFSSIAHRGEAAAERLNRVEFFWADERCVAPNHPESNFGIARLLLFTPLAIPPTRIHRIRGELEKDQAAAEAEKELRRLAPVNAAGCPILDLIFLGMGEDGHVASLFPEGADDAQGAGKCYQAVVASKPPPERVTITYEIVAAAREVWVIASGAGKVAALQESLRDDGKTPLARVLRKRGRTFIFTDISVKS
jgi:6-phosphogluconolactonase